jgi:septation ring formation regulator
MGFMNELHSPRQQLAKMMQRSMMIGLVLFTFQPSASSAHTYIATGNDAGVFRSFSWLEVTMFTLIFVLLVWAAVTGYKQWVHRQLKQLENWKRDLEKRPFSEQLSRVKELTMAGETEEQFEKWKNEWEEILTNVLPHIEQKLLDVEQRMKWLRFFNANKLMEKSRDHLQYIERSLQKIVEEIDDLMATEKQTRAKGNELKEMFSRTQAEMHKNSAALGIAYDGLKERSKQLLLSFAMFQRDQEEGNYYKAQDRLESLAPLLYQYKRAVHEMPAHLQEIQRDLPQKLKELRQAVQEMKVKLYELEHTEVETRLASFDEWKFMVQEALENSDLEQIEEWKEETKTLIEDMFTTLEQEVTDKAYVFERHVTLDEKWNAIQQTWQEVQSLCQSIKKAYSWDKEWAKTLGKLEVKVKELAKIYERCQVNRESLHQLYPSLIDDMKVFEEEYEKVQERMDSFYEKLKAVREDELQAQNVCNELKLTLKRLNTQLRKSNLPGLPEYVRSGIEVAEKSVQELEHNLRQEPINMTRVHHQVKEAEEHVHSITQKVESLMQQASNAEFLIQYANRYRRGQPEIQEMLKQAEQAFRNYEYREALEFAEEVLDRADEDWRSKVNIEKQSVS